MTNSSFPDFVCRHCHEPVNKFTSFFGAGEVTFRHGRPGPYDHEVDPIPRSEATHVVQICDFCSDSDVVWVYRTHGKSAPSSPHRPSPDVRNADRSRNTGTS